MEYVSTPGGAVPEGQTVAYVIVVVEAVVVVPTVVKTLVETPVEVVADCAKSV